jgi:hypothetical protein
MLGRRGDRLLTFNTPGRVAYHARRRVWRLVTSLERVVVEHRIVRLVGLGIRKSRHFGRKKTCFQARKRISHTFPAPKEGFLDGFLGKKQSTPRSWLLIHSRPA